MINKNFIRGLVFALSFFALSISLASAHQPNIVNDSANIAVVDPEVSKAYYGRLEGTPAVYGISSDKEFLLYVNILVPDLKTAETDFSIIINQGENVIKELKSDSVAWTKFYEPFAGDDYLKGPEFEQKVPAGDYKITVSSPDNKGKYVLATGKIESFPPSQILNTITSLPELKIKFFEKSVFSSFLNITGIFMLVILAVFSLIIFVAYKIYKKVTGKKKR